MRRRYFPPPAPKPKSKPKGGYVCLCRRWFGRAHNFRQHQEGCAQVRLQRELDGRAEAERQERDA